MRKYTPGPWALRGYQIRADEGQGQHVATYQISAEDGKIIAAAPEMVDLLIEAAEALDAAERCASSHCTADRIREFLLEKRITIICPRCGGESWSGGTDADPRPQCDRCNADQPGWTGGPGDSVVPGKALAGPFGRDPVPTRVKERGWQWHPTDDDTAFAPPFGTIRECIDCGCLVAGGPTRCGRCAEAAAGTLAGSPPADANSEPSKSE
jgi:hypothetical protein